MPDNTVKTDALVVGGGIAGLQAALDLADMGFKVVVLEKDSSIGGKMIRLSKVFPTLDCSSCITTPKMAAAAHHENITIMTCCDLLFLERKEGKIYAAARQRPRYVDPDKCIGCRKCEYACPVMVPDPEQCGFSATKAIAVPFSNAYPQLAVLNPENCMLCGKCAKVCPTGAVDYNQKPYEFTISAGAAVITTGFQLNRPDLKPEYGAGLMPNVVSSLAMERLLAPHGPYMRVLRPGDGKEPGSIAFVQCAGSRDRSQGVPYCSRVCCMYAIKQAMLLSGALPIADITIYYMDIRAFGKNHEQFFQNAGAMGIEFVRAKAGRIFPGDGGSVVIRHEDQKGGGVCDREHDLVVLAPGILPGWTLEGAGLVAASGDGFVKSPSPKLSPTVTTMTGVFAAGAALGPKDIVDSIVEAGAAAAEAGRHIAGLGSGTAA